MTCIWATKISRVVIVDTKNKNGFGREISLRSSELKPVLEAKDLAKEHTHEHNPYFCELIPLTLEHICKGSWVSLEMYVW